MKSFTHHDLRSHPIHYLAGPYTHELEDVRAMRAADLSRAAGRLMTMGAVVFSPITHGHHLVDCLPVRDAESHGFWMMQCLPMLARCQVFSILPLIGWDQSKGIRHELDLAIKAGLTLNILQDLGNPRCEDFTIEGARSLGSVYPELASASLISIW